MYTYLVHVHVHVVHVYYLDGAEMIVCGEVVGLGSDDLHFRVSSGFRRHRRTAVTVPVAVAVAVAVAVSVALSVP